MKKIYVGCSLTHASPEFIEKINELKENLKGKYEILEFIGLVNGTAKDVFEWDSNCVKSSDLFIAICDYPSIGLGIEIGIAIENNKNTIAVAHKDAKVTRMVQGAESESFTFIRYENLADVLSVIEAELAN
jgi:nucleoside 2-deoxyribosyltransferase